MRPIFLIGYMGSGKSTLGRLVSKATGMEFIDLDHYIENRYHKTIKELFAEKSEEGFREIERAMLHEVGEMQNVIVACGGGTPCFFDNMDYINQHGTSILLEASHSVLLQRLARGKHKRPLLANLSEQEMSDFIKAGIESRSPHYNKAEHRFNTSLLECEYDREETARRFMERFMPGTTHTLDY